MWAFQFSVGAAFGKYTDEILDYCRERQDSLEYVILIKINVDDVFKGIN